MGKPVLLSIVELGGYPNFTPLYEQAGYEVHTVSSVRKANSALKKLQPAVVVAEFNFQSDFRDRSSSLESLMATLQRLPVAPRVVVFYEKEQAGFLPRLTNVYPVSGALSFPVDERLLIEAISVSG